MKFNITKEIEWAREIVLKRAAIAFGVSTVLSVLVQNGLITGDQSNAVKGAIEGFINLIAFAITMTARKHVTPVADPKGLTPPTPTNGSPSSVVSVPLPDSWFYKGKHNAADQPDPPS